jgi:hypothetical protein
VRSGRAAGFADADTDTRQRQRRHARGHAAENRHRAPERQRDRDDVAAIEAVGEARDRDAEQRIEQHEAEACEQAHRGVAERKLLFDRLDQDVEDGAVEEVQRIDDGQQAKHVIAPDRGFCGGIRLQGCLWRKIDHAFPLDVVFFAERAASRFANEIPRLEFNRRRV